MESKPKRTMTEKQKIARLDNLKKGREKRKEMLKQKKESYDISSSDDSGSDSSSSDSDAFVISKAQKKTKPPKSTKSKVTIKEDSPIKKSHHKVKDNMLESRVDQLTNAVMELATMQKKQHKAVKKGTKRSSGGNKLQLILPQSTSTAPINVNAEIERLRKSLL